MTTTATYRITERNDETDALVRVVAVLTDETFRAANAMLMETIASDGNHIRLERWVDHPDVDTCGWEYL